MQEYEVYKLKHRIGSNTLCGLGTLLSKRCEILSSVSKKKESSYLINQEGLK